MTIIGYFHICQKEGWQRSFDIIFQEIKNSGLYDNTDEIRCIVVNDYNKIIQNYRFNDDKIKLFYKGSSSNYERPALLHMQQSSLNENCNYWYVHTKGLRWFNTERETNVIDWIKLMLYWNITAWKQAILHLDNFQVYGCNFTTEPVPHFSGNFWWATSEYVKKLQNTISNGYNDPEFWLFSKNPLYKNVFSSGLEGMGHYFNPYKLYSSMNSMIVIVSGHYPSSTYYSTQTREIIQEYASFHNYNFYYDDENPSETYTSSLHFMRCESIRKASIKFPEAKWFVWLDSDVYVNFRYEHLPLETYIDVSDENILYHLFHEAPWDYPINTGVKFVNKKALHLEEEIWELRNTSPWNEFPFEQKTLYEYILPKLTPEQYIIHDPYKLNCIIKAYPEKIKDALLLHMCAMTTEERNNYIDLRNKYKEKYKK